VIFLFLLTSEGKLKHFKINNRTVSSYLKQSVSVSLGIKFCFQKSQSSDKAGWCHPFHPCKSWKGNDSRKRFPTAACRCENPRFNMWGHTFTQTQSHVKKALLRGHKGSQNELHRRRRFFHLYS